jgi:hypothetical protein
VRAKWVFTARFLMREYPRCGTETALDALRNRLDYRLRMPELTMPPERFAR